MSPAEQGDNQQSKESTADNEQAGTEETIAEMFTFQGLPVKNEEVADFGIRTVQLPGGGTRRDYFELTPEREATEDDFLGVRDPEEWQPTPESLARRFDGDVIRQINLLSYLIEDRESSLDGLEKLSGEGERPEPHSFSELDPEYQTESRRQRLVELAWNGDKMDLTERFEDALKAAFQYHSKQNRKGDDGTPYIGHLLGVTAIVIDAGGTEDEAIAALLHDAAEDQGGQATLDEIRDRFGDQVAEMVSDLSDTFEDPKPPWLERKSSYLRHLETVSQSTLKVSLADKLYNARAIALDRARVGEKVWERFTGTREQCLDYYTALGKIYFRRLGETPLVLEYQQTINGLRTELVIASGSHR